MLATTWFKFIDRRRTGAPSLAVSGLGMMRPMAAKTDCTRFFPVSPAESV